jgi:hypothetical protein
MKFLKFDSKIFEYSRLKNSDFVKKISFNQIIDFTKAFKIKDFNNKFFFFKF